MNNDQLTYPFSQEEWETCIRVLEMLKNDPVNNPDNEHFKSLINKIKKNARKSIRKESYQFKKEADLKIQKESVIVSNALNGTSFFTYEGLDENSSYTKLNIPKNCYSCNKSFQHAHFFYNRICPSCAELNYEKRFLKTDLTGKVAILTGSRVKVGYATALKLLRNNATVVGTTRFPALALEQFQKEEDYNDWKDRLTVYGLDLRNLKSIERFVGFIKEEFSQVDILINNAAQTIKYPDEYYLPLINKEQLLLTQNSQHLIPNETPIGNDIKLIEASTPDLENIPLTRFGQPVDNRDKTSWNSTLDEVGLIELLEVNLINQIAPYHLIKELKPLMINENGASAFIINVTSSEGIFSYHNKTIFHPHTNMTKASLNMMTRTSASDFAEDRIYMNAVDVGWISTGAKETLRKKQFEKAYVPPLDSVDGACRILDPIVEGYAGNPVFGKLLKDYKEHAW